MDAETNVWKRNPRYPGRRERPPAAGGRQRPQTRFRPRNARVLNKEDSEGFKNDQLTGEEIRESLKSRNVAQTVQNFRIRIHF